MTGHAFAADAPTASNAPEIELAQATPPPAPPKPNAAKAATDLSEVVINGIPYRETVLPTRLSTSSTYGLNLNVMDTPRNTTLISATQIETLNIDDPRAFSYLTSSSYTDSAFGTPNIPRIRGQYADVFYNGMRASFTDNGYGVPINFDSFQNVAITKGPATVADGPGPGVGGEVDLLTKRPDTNKLTEVVDFTIDSVSNRRWMVDVGGPIIKGDLGFLISYSGEDSGSYFYDHFMRKNAVYGALRWTPNDKYKLDFNTEINVEQYTENVGINRVNQNLIDNGTYLQGAPIGEIYSSSFGLPPIPVGSPGNPYSPVTPIFTVYDLTGQTQINPKITIDQTPGTSSRGLLYNAQLIQSYKFDNGLTLENNTFFNFQNSDNQEAYYYADASNGSWTIENRTDVTGEFNLPFSVAGAPVQNQFVAGASFRYAYTNYISDFNAETPAVYDLTSNPNLWVFSAAYQLAYANAYYYTSVFGRQQLGVPGRDETNAGNTGVSSLYDTALFFQDRVIFDPEWSFLFGARIDAVQNHTSDPLGGSICEGCYNTLQQNHTTGVYGLGDVNTSLVYTPQPWITGYLTFDWTQSVNPNGGEGGINTYGQAPDFEFLRSNSYLYEAGVKLNVLNNKLFVGSAVFDQKHGIPTGPGGTVTDQANIRGVEIEANYQPTRNLFATASYSYINTELNSAPSFYNYPAQPGVNYDGNGLFAVFLPGQKFQDPGMPEHVFNFLGNYKFPIGVGVRGGVQVTGPIATTASGKLDVAASSYYAPIPASIVANGGYYQSPVIPWQYTMNGAVFYEYQRYTITFSIYNITNQRNWQPSPTFYGNDFLVQNDPRTYELRLQAKF